MSLQSIIDATTNPQVAVPIATVGAVANWLEVLPYIVSAGWMVYILVLVGHTAWKWRRDMKIESERRGSE